MIEAILVVNAGSTSLKFGVYQAGADLPLLCSGGIDSMESHPHFSASSAQGASLGTQDWPQAIDHRQALAFVVDWLEKHEQHIRVTMAGHRVVLGGTRFSGPALVTAEVLDYLDGLVRMEPSHQPYNVLGARVLLQDYSHLHQVCCFDTSFHRSMPELAQNYALPKDIRDTGARHWGYHGISYDYISRQLARHAPQARRAIACHLGGGTSMCAMLDGKSIETTMGFGAITGLPMSTRSGDVPADLLFYLMKSGGFTPETLEQALYHRSGLLGLSGKSDDMRELQESTDPDAQLAVNYFVYAMTKYAGAYASVLGGLDALVFTAGIGEHSAIVRSRLCASLAWLGVHIDEQANAANHLCISKPDSAVSVWVIPTNEELMIARHTFELAGKAAA
ncbi:MAG: acetate/propionate family kinase [Corticimicrobacter sp.]|uniref:acetate/propionate family kinase n=1 Tax=Corticimicrobacter sp. TaxID=2678536 RepID=UPI0032DB66D0